MEQILGYSVFDGSLDACAEQIVQHVQARDMGGTLACLNPHSYVTARRDAVFAQALRQARWLVPDGAGIVLASQLLGGHIRQRVTGPDVFMRLHQLLNERGGARVFFLGASDSTLLLMRQRLQREFPQLVVAGVLSPPFKEHYTDAENAAMVAAVNAAKPDVLWVAMTAPKQEKWLQEHRVQLQVPFAAAVGAAFDFYAGNVHRSSPWFRRHGLEWLPRLLREPGRLWRRTLVSGPLFLRDVWLERWRIGRR